MKNENVGNFINASPDEIEWIFFFKEGPASRQRGIGFLDGKLVYWKGSAVEISLARSSAIYAEIARELRDEDKYTHDYSETALINWMEMLSKNLKDEQVNTSPADKNIQWN